jgi:DNA-binding phage protein
MRATVLESNRQVELFEIGVKMKQQKISADFIAAAVRTAIEFEGVFDLMKMWEAETDKKERAEIIADIQDMIDDCSEQDSSLEPFVKITDLDKISQNVLKFKDNLRLIVDQNGGVGELSALTGIPQPSLSRFFSSGSMPRRTTLIKIGRALKIDSVTMAKDWSL